MKPWGYYEAKRREFMESSNPPEQPSKECFEFSHEGVEEYNLAMAKYESAIMAYNTTAPTKTDIYTEFYDDCKKQLGDCPLWPRIMLNSNEIMKLVEDGTFGDEYKIIRILFEFYNATKKSVVYEVNRVTKQLADADE